MPRTIERPLQGIHRVAKGHVVLLKRYRITIRLAFSQEIIYRASLMAADHALAMEAQMILLGRKTDPILPRYARGPYYGYSTPDWDVLVMDIEEEFRMRGLGDI